MPIPITNLFAKYISIMKHAPEHKDYFSSEEIQKLAISKVDEKIVKLFLATM